LFHGTLGEVNFDWTESIIDEDSNKPVVTCTMSMSPGGSMMSVKGLDISIYGHPRMSLALGVGSSRHSEVGRIFPGQCPYDADPWALLILPVQSDGGGLRRAPVLRILDVGVAGSSPATPTIDFPSYFFSDHALGVSFTSTLVQI
jgi:hypothetical protein